MTGVPGAVLSPRYSGYVVAARDGDPTRTREGSHARLLLATPPVSPGDELHDPSDEQVRRRAAAEGPLDQAGDYAVVVVDPQTGEIDVHGPFSGPNAVLEAGRRRDEFDRADLGDVVIQVARLHVPGPD